MSQITFGGGGGGVGGLRVQAQCNCEWNICGKVPSWNMNTFRKCSLQLDAACVWLCELAGVSFCPFFFHLNFTVHTNETSGNKTLKGLCVWQKYIKYRNVWRLETRDLTEGLHFWHSLKNGDDDVWGLLLFWDLFFSKGTCVKPKEIKNELKIHKTATCATAGSSTITGS